MRVRPIDMNGDMMPIYESSQMLEGAEAVAQVVKERLLFFQGEWWEDETLGIALPEFMSANVKTGDYDMFGKFLTGYISQTEGVKAVTDASLVKQDRGLIFRCIIIADDGNASVEVDLNGLL